MDEILLGRKCDCINKVHSSLNRKPGDTDRGMSKGKIRGVISITDSVILITICYERS